VEFWFAFFELVGETFAVFEFIEIGGDGVGCAFACWRAMLVSFLEGEGLRADCVGRGQLPKAFNSLQACSQALASLDEIYTRAPFATKPSEIMRPMPFAPPVTRTTLSC
jgi:hypothetical protein